MKVPEDGRLRDYTLDAYLSEFPPSIYLVDGSTVVGRTLYPFRPPEYDLPPGLIRVEDWRSLGCDIRVEDAANLRGKRRTEFLAGGKCSVLKTTGLLIARDFRSGTVAFCDHRRGEIADYVVLESSDGRLRVHLYHCKASQRQSPGLRQHDAYEVLGQSRKCTRWLHRGDLFDVMRRHLAEAATVIGSQPDFDRLVATSTPQTAQYKVHVVQPGFAGKELAAWRDPSMRLLFLSLYDELSNDGVELSIVASA